MDPLRPNHFYNLPDELQHKIMIMRPPHPCADIIKELQGLVTPHYRGQPSYGMLWTIRFDRLTANDHIPKTNALIKVELRKFQKAGHGSLTIGKKAELTHSLLCQRWWMRGDRNTNRKREIQQYRRDLTQSWYECEKTGEV